MKALILQGSMRRGQNTETLTEAFSGELRRHGVETACFAVSEMNVAPCRGCYACQQVSGEYGCVIHDDMYAIVGQLIRSDLIVLATPIYSWYCPAPLKAVLDRHYGLNKYYGAGTGRLWKSDARIALLLTYGYEQDYATRPFVTGIQNLCKHSHIGYAGMYGVRDEDDLASFTAPEALEGACAFARGLLDG